MAPGNPSHVDTWGRSDGPATARREKARSMYQAVGNRHVSSLQQGLPCQNLGSSFSHHYLEDIMARPKAGLEEGASVTQQLALAGSETPSTNSWGTVTSPPQEPNPHNPVHLNTGNSRASRVPVVGGLARCWWYFASGPSSNKAPLSRQYRQVKLPLQF